MFRLAILCLFLAGCSKGPQQDLQYISQARSLGAEWAMVNELAAQGKLTGVYVEAMHKAVRKQLRATCSALPNSPSDYGQEIRALMAMPDGAPPADLRAHVRKLKAIEDSLESN